MFSFLKKARNLSFPLDDTVILAENPNDLQASLNEMEKYCDTFDLHINVNKTKILIFSEGKITKTPYF